MRTPPPLRVAVLGLIVLAAPLAGGRIAAQKAPGPGSDAPSGPAPPAEGRRLAPQDGPSAAGGIVHGPVAGIRHGPRRFVKNGGQILAEVKVELMDTRDTKLDFIHIWRFKAVRIEDKVQLLNIPYIEQAFEIDPSGRMTASFSEHYRLPPGKYRVSVALLKVPKGFDLAQLHDEAKVDALEGVLAQGTVSTP